MTNRDINNFIQSTSTPPPPVLKQSFSNNKEVKNITNLTTNQAIHFDENMNALNNILAQVESLIGMAKENPEVLTECSRLMRNAADIDLPSEIKNQKISTYPSVIQEMYKETTKTSTSNSFSQITKQQATVIHVQQNLSDIKNKEYVNQQHYLAMNTLNDAVTNNKPITFEMICKHCNVIKDVINREKHGIQRCQELMEKYLIAPTTEERQKIWNDIRHEAKYATKEWAKRKDWHKTTRYTLANGKNLTPEQLKQIDVSLRKEEETAKQILTQAQYFRKIALKEKDPKRKKELLDMATESEQGANAIFAENKASRKEYNKKTNGKSTNTNKNNSTAKTSNTVSAPQLPTKQTTAAKENTTTNSGKGITQTLKSHGQPVQIPSDQINEELNQILNEQNMRGSSK